MTTVREELEKLRALVRAHSDVAMALLKSRDGYGTMRDMIAVMVLNRSVNLLDGFAVLIERRNFTAAAPLVRMQMDNCMRFYALWLVDNPDDMALRIISGASLNKMKSSTGRTLTDAYLVEQLTRTMPWCKDVYQNTSGYVHLSNKHFSHAYTVKDKSESVLSVRIGVQDEGVSDDDYVEAIQAFLILTEAVLHFTRQLIKQKEASVITLP